MANLGLLGAVKGLGQSLNQIGTDIISRRERALEQARKEAEYRRSRQDKLSDDAANRDFQAQQQREREEAAMGRTQATIAARKEEKAEERTYKTEESAASREHERSMAELRSRLEKDNSEASTRLKEQLDDKDVKRVEYDKPRESDGRSRVILILNDGTIRNTNSYVYRPPKSTDDIEDLNL